MFIAFRWRIMLVKLWLSFVDVCAFWKCMVMLVVCDLEIMTEKQLHRHPPCPQFQPPGGQLSGLVDRARFFILNSPIGQRLLGLVAKAPGHVALHFELLPSRIDMAVKTVFVVMELTERITN